MEADETSPAQPPEKSPKGWKDKIRLSILFVVLAMVIIVIALETYRSVSTGTAFSMETFEKVLDGLIKVLTSLNP